MTGPTVRTLALSVAFPASVAGLAACGGAAATAGGPVTVAATAPNTLGYTTGDPSKFAPETDAVVAAAKNHKVMMENEKVRVLDVTLAPGEVEAVHSHRWPSVLYVLQAGDFVDRDASGKVVFDTRTLPAPLTFPLTMWKEPEAPHSVENLSKTVALHLVRVELKGR